MYYGLLRLGFKETDFELRDDSDGKGAYIDEWRSDKPQPSAEAIKTAQDEYEAEYASLEYARKRKEEYDQLNQYEMMFDDKRDSTTTWVDKINEIKGKYPK